MAYPCSFQTGDVIEQRGAGGGGGGQRRKRSEAAKPAAPPEHLKDYLLYIFTGTEAFALRKDSIA